LNHTAGRHRFDDALEPELAGMLEDERPILLIKVLIELESTHAACERLNISWKRRSPRTCYKCRG
jgi:hypothetical protein